MFTTKIAGAAAALALLAAPSVAAAHGGHHNGHHHKHHARKAQVRNIAAGAPTATVASFTNGELTLTTASGRSFTATVNDRTIITCFTAAPQPAPPATAARHGGDDNSGSDEGPGNGSDDNSGSDDGANHDANDNDDDDNVAAAGAPKQDAADDAPNHDANDDNDDDDNGQGAVNGNGRCDATALVAGAKVAAAKLSLLGTDATWKKIVVIK